MKAQTAEPEQTLHPQSRDWEPLTPVIVKPGAGAEAVATVVNIQSPMPFEDFTDRVWRAAQSQLPGRIYGVTITLDLQVTHAVSFATDDQLTAVEIFYDQQHLLVEEERVALPTGDKVMIALSSPVEFQVTEGGENVWHDSAATFQSQVTGVVIKRGDDILEDFSPLPSNSTIYVNINWV
ncbi:MAG: hypothetical protein JO360_13300 [Acidobacteria bacterium]|nr:hypothetical protein [Acidobacteriota bacterium]